MLERDLRCFLALAETRSFTRAAERLFVTQPAFSRRIAELEDDLGCQLVLRTTRPVELTPEGKVFLKWATILLHDLEQMETAMAAARRGVAGQLRIGYNGSNHLLYLNRSLHELEQKNEGMDCLVKRAEPPRLEHYLFEGRLDGMFTNLPHAKSLSWAEFATVEQCGVWALLNGRSPLAKRKELHFFELTGQPYVSYARAMSPHAYDFVREVCRTAGFRPQVAVSVEDVEEIAVMVEADRGFALMSGTAAQSFRSSKPDHLAAIPLADAPTGFDLVFCWNKEHTSAALFQFLQGLAAAAGAK